VPSDSSSQQQIREGKGNKTADAKGKQQKYLVTD
jgi:hypothetical protein